MQPFQMKAKRPNQPLLSLRQIDKVLKNGQQILSNISFNLMQGEILYLCGHSGAGKTSLLNLCALLDHPSQGQLMFNGVDSAQLSPNKKLQLRRLIGVIPQTPKFLRDQTVFDNLALPLKVAQHTQQEITKRVYDMLEQIGMTLYAQAYPQMLSSGEQECINIARALITRPILVLADEPTSHVDHSAKQKMLDLLMTANKFGVSMLVATHDLALVARSKGRALFLKKGCLANEERAA